MPSVSEAALLPPPAPALLSLPATPIVREIRMSDRTALADLIAGDGPFVAEEVACALELIDAALADPSSGYRVLVAELAGRVSGYVCFGPTPMTTGTYDLYWIATAPALRGRGVASALVETMERALRAEGARLVRVETSHLEDYGPAHRFYVRHRYPIVARLPDFYRPGDDLVVMLKQL
jgi:ribosomal protein S18 acetylase RimI-like enzyme